VIIDIEKLVKWTSGNRSSIDHELAREAASTLPANKSKMSSLRDLYRIAVTLSHGIQTANDSFTSDTGVVSIESFKRIGFKNHADGIPSSSSWGNFKTRVELAQIIRADHGMLSSLGVDMNPGKQKTLTKELSEKSGLSLAGVPHNRIEDQTIKLRILVNEEKSAELIKVEIFDWQQYEGSNIVPFLVELKEIGLIAMHLGFRDVWPFRWMGPVDFRIKINSSELAVIYEWAGVKGGTEIPFDSVSTDFAHRVRGTIDKSRVDSGGIDETWFGNMLDICSGGNRSVWSRDTGRSIEDLLEVSHPAFKRRKRKLSTTELIESTTKFAAGATPQANSDVAKSL